MPPTAEADSTGGLRRRRVLILAYHFPPLGGGGVQRTLKHVKYLPEHGFDPIVVTTRGFAQPVRDASLVSEVPPQAVVLRAPELPLNVAKWGLQSALRRLRLPIEPAQAVGWPDEFVGWVPGAVWHALRAVRRYRPDVLYSTSLPVSAHRSALIVSRRTGLPWVADFRDAWTLNPEGHQMLARASSALERRIVSRASRLVVVDDSIELVGAGPDDPRRLVIPNGVDPDDVPPPSRRPRGPRFRLAHIGMLYGARDAGPVVAALGSLITRGAVDSTAIELRFVGSGLDRGMRSGTVPVSHRGFVGHRDALAEMAAADALLLYQPPGWRGTSGKIYEYLATGRPILCVVPEDSVAARLVSDLRAGVCVAPDDQTGIEQAIETLHASWAAGNLAPNAAVREETLRRYSRRALAGSLAAALDSARSSGSS